MASACYTDYQLGVEIYETSDNGNQLKRITEFYPLKRLQHQKYYPKKLSKSS